MQKVLHLVNSVRNIVETAGRHKGRSIYSFILPETEVINPFFNPAENKTLLKPEKDSDGYWVGAPSPFIDENEVLLYYRVRDADRRGKKGVIARLEDNELEEIWSIDKEEIPAHSIEGAAISRRNGRYKLYLSYHDLHSNTWKIDIIEADSIEELDYSESRPLEVETGKHVNIKDPVVYGDKLIVHSSTKYWFSQTNFLVTNPLENPEAERIAFEGSEGRITSVTERNGEELVFYDWERSLVFTGEEKAKLGRMKANRVEEITRPNQTLASSYGTGSLRYVKPVKAGDEYWFFYEKSMPNNGHKLCMKKVSSEKVENLKPTEID